MKRLLVLAPLLLVAACGGGGDDDDDIFWEATFTGSETSGTSTGGVTIQASGSALALPAGSWLFEEEGALGLALPPVDGAALAAVPGAVDVAATPRGLVALLPDSALVLVDGGPPSPAPEGCERVILAEVEPLRVRLVRPDGTSVLATLVGE